MLVGPVDITDRLPCAHRCAKTFGKRGIIDFKIVFGCGLFFKTGLDMCLLQEKDGKLKHTTKLAQI